MARLGFIIAIFAAALACHSARAEDLIKKLMTELDSEDFARRDDAQRQLRELSDRVLPDLKSAVQKKPITVELQTRLQLLIKNIESDIEERKNADRRQRAVVQTYYIQDLVDATSNLRSPELTFGGNLNLNNYWGSEERRTAEAGLVKVVKEMVDPLSWDHGRFNVTIFQSALIVSHTPEIQGRIAALLEVLRAETEAQVAITCLLLQPNRELEKTTYSAAEMDAVLKESPPQAVVLKSRILCANLRRAVHMEGKQIEYVSDKRVMSTEGGGAFTGISVDHCLQGYAISLQPKMNRANGSTKVELRFYRNLNLQMRDFNELEKWIASQQDFVGEKTKLVGLEKPENPAAAELSKKSWVLPAADLQVVHTEVTISRGMWICAGRMPGAQKNGEKKAESYLFLKAETLELAPEKQQ
jgi:hypothetical protein